MSEAELPRGRARAIVESILLTAEDPVTPSRLSDLLGDDYQGKDIRDTVDELNRLYEEHGHGITIVEVAGGYQLATPTEMSPWVRRFHRDRGQVRLSQAALETLAIVAFKQPLTRVEVDSIRGVSSASVMQRLMELDLVRIVGRSDGVGKPMLFGTTREFLILFGLKSLAALPKPKELEELLAQGEQKAQLRDQLSLALDTAANQQRDADVHLVQDGDIPAVEGPQAADETDEREATPVANTAAPVASVPLTSPEAEVAVGSQPPCEANEHRGPGASAGMDPDPPGAADEPR